MKRSEVVLSLVSLMMLCHTTCSPAHADNEDSNSSKTGEVLEPTKEQLKNSKDRALYIDPISPKNKTTKPVQDKKVVKPKAKKTVKKAKVKRVKKTRKHKPAVAKKKSLYKTIPSNVKTTKKTVKASPKPKQNIKKVSFSNRSNIIAASLNKAGKIPQYKDGEKLKVSVKAYEDCNLMIFNFDGRQLTQIFPNEFQTNPRLSAGSSVVVGGSKSKFDFVVSNQSAKPSKEKIFVYAYPVKENKQPITIAMNKVPSTPFRSTEMTLEQYRKLVNSSKAFFERSVKVVSKSKNELATFDGADGPPNKLELSLVIHKK